MKHALLFLSVILLFAKNTLAQPAVEFIRNYDIGRHERFFDIYAVEDGGYVMCGASSAVPLHWGSILVTRVDAAGREIWSQIFDAGGKSDAYSIIEADGGDYVIGGRVDNRFHALRVTSEGNLVWRSDYNDGVCNAVIELKDGRFLLAGNNSFRSPRYSRIICIDGEGNVEWDRVYDQIEYSTFSGIKETENAVVATGSGRPAGINRGYAWAVKAALNDGDALWTHHYTEGDRQFSTSGMASAGDGGFVLCGGWNSDNMLPGITTVPLITTVMTIG